MTDQPRYSFSAHGRFPCVQVPGDGLDVAVVHDRAREAREVLVRVTIETGEHLSVLFDAERARRVAAALLNAADSLDGTTPLVFFPPAPETGEPTR